MQHITPDDVEGAVLRKNHAETGSATVTLKAGDTAWNPASTKHVIHGPARVRYTIHPDGGVDATIL